MLFQICDVAANGILKKNIKDEAEMSSDLPTSSADQPRNAFVNACLYTCMHKRITDDLDLVQVERNFIDVNDKRKEYFGSLLNVLYMYLPILLFTCC